MIILLMVNALITIVPILLSVAFFTLLERKVLSAAHFRLGPNKVGTLGILQPFSDALKLLSKEAQKLLKANYVMLMMAPAGAMLVYSFIWNIMPSSASKMSNSLVMLMFFAVISVSVFFLISSGWASNCKYGILGAFRSMAQTISYEISLILISLPPIFMLMIMDLEVMGLSLMSPVGLLIAPLVLLWVFSALAETHRTPFDLSESESELVSGFNTEYSSGSFSMIFISEYSALIVISMMTYCLLTQVGTFMAPVMTSLMMVLFIWARATYPRMRYDKLMSAFWKTSLTPSICIVMVSLTSVTLM